MRDVYYIISINLSWKQKQAGKPNVARRRHEVNLLNVLWRSIVLTRHQLFLLCAH